jgi:hypothetical protein
MRGSRVETDFLGRPRSRRDLGLIPATGVVRQPKVGPLADARGSEVQPACRGAIAFSCAKKRPARQLEGEVSPRLAAVSENLGLRALYLYVNALCGGNSWQVHRREPLLPYRY